MEFSPASFDILGFCAFAFIIAFALAGLSGKSLPKWAYVLLLLVGLGGLIVDGVIVYINFLQ